MLKPDMINKLNEQINLEFYSSNLYLQMSAWCEEKGFDGAAEFMRKHAAEEMEHKAVAFDVYRAVGGGEKMRKRALRRATVLLLIDILVGVVHMLRRDGKLWNLRLWWQGWKFLFFEGGLLRRVWPAYREYFRDGFHPWQRDTRELLQAWQSRQRQAIAR